MNPADPSVFTRKVGIQTGATEGLHAFARWAEKASLTVSCIGLHSFEGLDISSYRISTIPLKPRFSAKADISSGDSPNSKTLGTFKRHQWTRFQAIRYAL